MTRRELILAGLAAAHGGGYTSVQVQKLFFLLDRNIPKHTGGPHFNFAPYNYGPFDKELYVELEALEADGLVAITPEHSWSVFSLTERGLAEGSKALNTLPTPVRQYMEQISDFVRSLSFPQLVSAIYKAYPEMRENSVFKG
jgi:hypothetical protein